MTIETRHPRVEIEFCTGCKWHLRAGWMAQELLLTFGNTIGELALIPGKSATFIVRVNGDVVFDRKDHGRFPEMKEVKQLVRTVIAPEMGLGHSDTAVKSAAGGAAGGAGGATGATQAHEEKKADAVAAPAPVTPAAQVDEDDEDSTTHDKECKTCV
ncbi:hypothetical protein BGZ95_011279 [Linnemannia exigua]|uniref:Uncharacterized protein n=1 Tax=Linnemannia exigua TaxID=604196 RepID=A0AAD4H5D8_9FUNG|nr:hypothetical protein BGZ95_011279 [Linnemannia exigua]